MDKKILTAEEEVEQFLKAFLSGMKNFYFHLIKLQLDSSSKTNKELELYIDDIEKLCDKYIFMK